MNKYLNYRLYGSVNSLNITESNKSIIFDYPCTNNSFCEPYYVTFNKAVYFIELWGAQGGGSYYNSKYYSPIGYCGYSCGFLIIKEISSFYLYVGGQGSGGMINVDQEALGGFNGGGTAPSDYCAPGDHDDPAGAGGGASDIRTSYNDHLTRLAVAGGGGGNGAHVGTKKLTYKSNSYGGGITSGGGFESPPSSQTEGTSDGVGEKGVCLGRSGGGGGGGYMGGKSGQSSGEGDNGSGGYGYVDGLNSYQGILPITIPGNTFFNSPYGGLEEGHKGHGSIKITLISPFFHNWITISIHRSFFLIHLFTSIFILFK